MLLRHKMLALTAALAFTAVLGMTAQAASDAVVASVNGQKIFKKDVDLAIEQLKPMLKNANPKEVFPQVVDQIINEKLLDDAATASKVAESKEFTDRLELERSKLEKQMYFERLLKSKVTDDKAKAFYKKIEKLNKGKVEVHARHILVPTEEEAKQVIKDLDAGKKFEELAQQRSAGPNAKVGGDLGWFVKEEMIPAFSDAAFKMKPGEYSKVPLKTEVGWHVIKIEDKRERQFPKYEDVQNDIKGTLSKQALTEVVADLRSKADVKLYGPNGEEVSDKPVANDKPDDKKADKKADDKKDDAKKDDKDAPKNAAQEQEDKEQGKE